MEGVHLALSPKLGTGPQRACKEGVHLGRVHLGRCHCSNIGLRGIMIMNHEFQTSLSIDLYSRQLDKSAK